MHVTKMPYYKHFCYQNVLLPKRPITEMSIYRNVQIPKCPVTEMSCYRNVCYENVHYQSVLYQNIWIVDTIPLSPLPLLIPSNFYLLPFFFSPFNVFHLFLIPSLTPLLPPQSACPRQPCRACVPEVCCVTSHGGPPSLVERPSTGVCAINTNGLTGST